MARQTIKIDSGGDLDFIADIIGDVGELLLDTKTEKLYAKGGWGNRSEEIARDFDDITNIVNSFQYMDTQQRDDALKEIEGLQEAEKAYQVRSEAKYALIKLNVLDDLYDKNEDMVSEIKTLNDLIMKDRGKYDYVQNTEYDSIIEKIQGDIRDNTDTYTKGTISFLDETLKEKKSMDRMVGFFDDWTDILETKEEAIDEVVYSIDRTELKKEKLIDKNGAIKLAGAREYAIANYSNLIRGWEGYQTIPDIPEPYREGIENMFDLWESGDITAANLYEMITKKETDIDGVEVQGTGLYGRNPYEFATSMIYLDINRNDVEASQKLDTVSKLFNEIISVTRAGSEGGKLIEEAGVTNLPLLTDKEAPNWNMYYSNLIQQMYSTLKFWAFEGPNDPLISPLLPDVQTPSKQLEGLRSVLEILDSPKYGDVDLYHGTGMGDERKQWAIRILKAMLDDGGLEDSRSEKTALYGDISRLLGKAAGEGIGAELSDEQRREMAEWKRTWETEEPLITEFVFPEEGKGGPVVGTASTLTQVLGGPVDIANLMFGVDEEEAFMGSKYLWETGLQPFPGVEAVPFKDIAEWVDWFFGGPGGGDVRNWYGGVIRRSGEGLNK
jgi:hypothetical protein